MSLPTPRSCARGGSYVLRVDGVGVIPLSVDLTLDGPFNYTVKVWKDGEGPPGSREPDRTDMVNWHWGDSGTVNAHEFGHMIGLFDEYMGGAIDDIASPTLDERGLMGYFGSGVEMRERYYQQYLDFFYDLNPTFRAELVAVPEGKIVGAVAILAAIILARGRRFSEWRNRTG